MQWQIALATDRWDLACVSQMFFNTHGSIIIIIAWKLAAGENFANFVTRRGNPSISNHSNNSIMKWWIVVARRRRQLYIPKWDLSRIQWCFCGKLSGANPVLFLKTGVFEKTGVFSPAVSKISCLGTRTKRSIASGLILKPCVETGLQSIILVLAARKPH